MSEELKILVIQAIARAWCDPKNAHKEMDSDLAIVAADEVIAALQAQQPAATAVPDWFNKEVADVDSLLRMLGVDLGQARSEGGRLRPLHVYWLLMDKFQAAKDALAVVRRAAKVDAALDKVATGTFVCPLCGRYYPHQHSPEEITIYGNGYGNGKKAGLLATGRTPANDPVPPLEWSPTLCDGKSITHSEAEKAAAALGEGWRLPTRWELESILDITRRDPAVDTTRFPDTKSTYYWTGMPCAWNASAVWVVDFGYGAAYDHHRGSDACVRAVRSSPAGQ